MSYHLPGDDNRHTIVGMTGSGKTQHGMYALSGRSYTTKPWTIIDFKRDKLIDKIPRIQEYDYTGKPPKRAGLYVVRPHPQDDPLLMEDFLMKIWEQENHGLFIDECYNIKRLSPALRGVLTQGRSKQIPVIALSQRPSWISPFLLSESEFVQAFTLRNPADLERMKDTIYTDQLPAHKSYQSLYYDVERNQLTRLAPCPDTDEILNRFDDRVPRRKVWL